jgi:nicotinate-nucleotide adenylyltransferase
VAELHVYNANRVVISSTSKDGNPGKTIALFGGSFNPPHVAHQMVALYALQVADIDEVWFVPTYRHVFGKELADYQHRVAMCELIARDFAGKAKVCTTEREIAELPGFVASRTLDLIEYLCGRHPDHRWRLLIGADILLETNKWHRWDQVAALAPPIVVGRTSASPQVPLVPDEGWSQSWDVTEFAMPQVSSTEVRSRIKQQQSAQWLVPRQVLRYIQDIGLYQ